MYLKRHLRPMKKQFLLLLFLNLSFQVIAQKTIIRGHVYDKSKQALVGANIFLRDTYDGATADAEGAFQFETEETGAQVLQVTYLGYDSVVQKITINGGVLEFNLVLR